MRLMTLLLVFGACRIERTAPASAPSSHADVVAGDVWVYTSIYRPVLDALDPLIHEHLPALTVHWFQGGSERVAAKLEAELTAGGTQCDVLLTSDPFLYRRLARAGRLLRSVSANGVRTPRSLVDPDGYWESVRVSTMVLVQRAGSSGPRSFEALAHPRWAGQIVIGDPLTSGTAFTWALSMEHQHGLGFFPSLRKNNVRIAGGNATVLQKVEGGEADVGVVLLENVLAAQKRGSAIEAVWPTDGAVVIPGPAAIVSSSRNKAAARAVIDILLSPEGQRLLSQAGEMHVVDPREGGPHGLEGIEALLAKSAPLTDALLDRGVLGADEFKARFTSTFSQ